MPRSTYYYQPRPESAETLLLLRRLDKLYLECPFFGSRRMAVSLGVNRKRAQRLMDILGIEALYPKPNLSRPAPGNEIYPYLLRGVSVERPNQVWSTDIVSAVEKWHRAGRSDSAPLRGVLAGGTRGAARPPRGVWGERPPVGEDAVPLYSRF